MNQIMNINGVDCYEENGVAFLRLSDVAHGLGFTRIASSGNEVIRWDRVQKYLCEIQGVPTRGHNKKEALPEYIPENVFYRLAMKAKNAVAEEFQAMVADKIIPSIRKHGGYMVGQEEWTREELLAKSLIYANSVMEERAARIEELEAETQAQAEQLAITEPKAEYYDAFVHTKTSTNFRTTAKEIGVGERNFINLLIDKNFLYRDKQGDLLPYTEKNRGYFIVRDVATGRWMGKQTFITEKGKQHFRKLCQKEGLIQPDQEIVTIVQPSDTFLM